MRNPNRRSADAMNSTTSDTNNFRCSNVTMVAYSLGKGSLFIGHATRSIALNWPYPAEMSTETLCVFTAWVLGLGVESYKTWKTRTRMNPSTPQSISCGRKGDSAAGEEIKSYRTLPEGRAARGVFVVGAWQRMVHTIESQ